eukprot:scaffold467621_cov21-Prasinocladus_malaysianus.AAC.1
MMIVIAACLELRGDELDGLPDERLVRHAVEGRPEPADLPAPEQVGLAHPQPAEPRQAGPHALVGADEVGSHRPAHDLL